MTRNEAIKTVEEIFGDDQYGINDTLTDEQCEAIQLALKALKNPECMSCGYCQRFSDEDAEGQGWCEEHDRSAICDDSVCGHYE